ncbi:MAG: cytochrome P450 [Nevskia sp.]|nr:cytochrome P450 [Nevskia sp.]
MNTHASSVYYDPYSPEISANPYPVFRRLREEAPLYYNKEHDFYAVSLYEDVERGLFDRETFISGRGAILELIKANAEFPPGILIFEDPPIHTAHRAMLARMFTPKRLNGLEAKVRDYCAQCLDPLVGSDNFDLIAELGGKMPMRVIGMLLGIPEEDQAAVKNLVDDSIRTESGKPMEFVLSNYSGEAFEDYIDWRAKHPSDDVMTEMLNAEFKDETGTVRKLARQEMLTLINVLAGAGNETTTRLIGWTGKVLAEHPDQRRQLVEDPTLIPQGIEEILRFEPPPPHIARYVNRDVEVRGQTIPKGSVMMFLVGSANRDERCFPDGDRFDINRTLTKRHLTFGYGVHTCLGAVLARLEGRVALEELLKRFPYWDVDLDRARLSPTSTVRGWETLPIYTRPGIRPSTSKARPETAVQDNQQPVTLDGTWNVTVKSPTGPMATVLALEYVDGRLTGTQSGQGTTTPISDIQIDGNQITWINHISKPMKMKLTFSGTVSGKEMSGKVKAGFMGSFQFTGVKA